MSIDTVSDLPPRVQYVANAAQEDFDYTFPIFDDADLTVIVDGAEAALNTDYTVSGAGDDTGGTVTFAVAMAGGEIVTITRESSIERDTDIAQNGPWSSAIYNDEQDKIFLILQELKAKFQRCLRIPADAEVDDDDIELTVANFANMYVTVDANGKPTPAALSATTMTQATIGQLLYPQTEAEESAGVTPVNYAYPPGDVRRIDYSADTTLQKYINACAADGIVLDMFEIEFAPTTELTLPNNAHLRGGVFLKPSTNNRLFTNADTVNGNENITLEGVVLDGQDEAFGGSNGVRFVNVDGVTVKGCTIRALHSTLTSGIVKFNPLEFSGCSNVIVAFNRMIDSARSGVFISDASGRVVIVGNIIERVENAGIVVQGTASDGTDPVESVTIIGNHIKDAHNGAYDPGTGYTGDQLYNQDGAIDVYQGGNRVVIANNVIDGFGIFGNDEQASPGGPDDQDGDGIRLTQTQGGIVTGNILISHADADVALYASSRSSVESKGITFAHNIVFVRGTIEYGARTIQPNVTFEDNHFISDDAGAEYGVAAIQIGAAVDGVKLLNNFSDVPGAGGSTPAIHLSAACTDCLIEGNRIQGAARGIYGASGVTLTRVKIRRNIINTPTQYGIYIDGTATRCDISDNEINGATTSGILIDASVQSKVNGNQIDLTGTHGIRLLAGNRDQVQNNTVTASGQTTDATYDNINVTGDNILVQGNMVYRGAETNKSRYGIRVNAGSNKVAVINNFVEEGGSSAEVSDAGTGTITTSGNIT